VVEHRLFEFIKTAQVDACRACLSATSASALNALVDGNGLPALAVAAAAGFDAIVSLLIEHGADATRVVASRQRQPVLHFAATTAPASTVALLLAAGAKVNALDMHGRSALQLAARSNENVGVVSALLQAGATLRPTAAGESLVAVASHNANWRVLQRILDEVGSASGCTLHSAALARNADGVRVLIKAGVKVDARDEKGRTALHLAAKDGNEATLSALLASGADPRLQCDGLSALHVAAQHCTNPRAISLLCKAGAPVNEGRNSPLLVAACRRDAGAAAIVTALIECGADVEALDKRGRTPLLAAVYSSARVAVLGALVAGGASLDACDARGFTCLHHAAVKRNGAEAIQFLRSKGADVYAVDAQRSCPIHRAAMSCTSDDESVFAALVADARASVNERTRGGCTPLRFAVRRGGPAVVQFLVRAGAEVNARTKSGDTALHNAAAHNPDARVIDALIAAGADVDPANKHNRTPLLMAARSNNDAVVAALLRHRADLHATDTLDNTALHAAAWNPDVNTVKLLLGRGLCAVNKPTYRGMTPLHTAASANTNPTVMATLVAAGGDVHVRDDSGLSVLHHAARSRNALVTKAVIRAGADVSARSHSGHTPLHTCAAFGSNAAVAQALMDAGVDPNAADLDGRTCIQNASALNRSPEILQALIDGGGKVRVTDRATGLTPLHTAARHSTARIVAVLLKAGADVNARCLEKRTPLHSATVDARIDIVRALCDAGADVNAACRQGRTPLHSFAMHGASAAILELLLSKGGDVHREDHNFRQPLHNCCMNGLSTPAMVVALLDAGADLGARERDRRTPLHCAASCHVDANVLLVLIARGADVRARDSMGFTPLMNAVMRSSKASEALIKALLNADPAAGEVYESKSRRTALHMASHFSSHRIVYLLCHHGSFDVNAPDAHSRTPLHSAVTKDDPVRANTVGVLLDAGADADVSDRQRATPCHLAAKLGDCASLQLLIAAGADLNRQDKSGSTPAHLAYDEQTLDVLQKAGADLLIRNRCGATAISTFCRES
jgi:ankyrin repeat protein